LNKTKIEWTNYSWNPIKGLCPQACWYCYGRAMHKRFKWNPELSWDGRVPILSNKKPSRIFVCSTIEMFHPQIPKEWRDRIFGTIEADFNKKHTFQILTKLPQNIDRPMPDNVWLGVSIVKGDEAGWDRIYRLKEVKARLKFISIEPILGMLNTPMISNMVDFDWFIFGRLTGYGKKHDPDKRWITPAVDYFRGYKKPVFLKDNLKEIWGDNLIQEFPKEGGENGGER